MHPTGQEQATKVSLPAELQPHFEAMTAAGFRIEADVVTPQEVALSIAPIEKHLAFRRVANGPSIKAAIAEMLTAKPWDGK